MRESLAIRRMDQAFEIINELELRGHEWGQDYRPQAREALKEVLQRRMELGLDRMLAEVHAQGSSDRRNGHYCRHLLTELGDIELSVPRTRRFSAVRILRAYARRADNIDRTILTGFVLGLSTRKVSDTLLPILGESVSATTVSRVAKRLDHAVDAYHRRPLAARYRALMFDGVVLSRKTGAGSMKRPVLVALGILPDGRKEVIDFRLARSESGPAWESFLKGLYRRGLTETGVQIISIDGGNGLKAAVRSVYPDVPLQRCWAHKNRNVLDKVRAVDRDAVKTDLHKVMHAKNLKQARRAAGRFSRRWSKQYPKAVKCLRDDLDELLECYRFKSLKWRKAVRTTNAIERRFREVKRRTRPMGVFSDRTSMSRILFAVFSRENQSQGVTPLFLLTQNS
jgi:putative transposase